jgi:Thioredoxin
MGRARGASKLAQGRRQVPGSRALRTRARGVFAVALAAGALLVALAVAGCGSGQAAGRARVDREVSTLLAGIPQHAATLGRPGAPFTMEVFIDLEDPTSRWWFRERLPAIVKEYVRPGVLDLRYHAFKRNTYWPAVFVKQQTAALAAGAQNRLWNFIDTFLYEQGTELTHYATERYLTGIAHQVPGLDLARWHVERHTGRREEQTAAEDQQALAIGLHVTPAFRIGRTGGRMSIFKGRTMIRYPEQAHPIALIDTTDIATALGLLHDHDQLPAVGHPQVKVIYERLE